MSYIHILSDHTYEKVINKNSIICYINDWAGPSKFQKVIFENLSDIYTNITFAVYDVDDNPVILENNNITSLPCIIKYKNGKEIKRINNYINKNDLEEFINENNNT